MAANANFTEIGKAFTQHYYATFDGTRANLQTLYKDDSLLTFENEQFMGMQSIMTKLTTLQFTTVVHQVTTVDSQPTKDGGIVTFVTGKLVVDGGANPLNFAQVFILQPKDNSWYIANDLFRLNYC